MFRTITLSILLFTQLIATSQNTDTVCQAVVIGAPIRAFFAGYLYKYEDESGFESFRMERSYFQKDFRLSLSDTSYRVVRFRFTTDLVNGDLLAVVGNIEGIKIDNDYYSKLIRKMTSRSLVGVDDIIVSKNGTCYKVPSFTCYFVNR